MSYGSSDEPRAPSLFAICLHLVVTLNRPRTSLFFNPNTDVTANNSEIEDAFLSSLHPQI